MCVTLLMIMKKVCDLKGYGRRCSEDDNEEEDSEEETEETTKKSGRVRIQRYKGLGEMNAEGAEKHHEY